MLFSQQRHTQLKVVQNNDFKIEMEAMNKKSAVHSFARSAKSDEVCSWCFFLLLLVRFGAVQSDFHITQIPFHYAIYR